MAKRKRTALKDQKANIFEYYQKNTHRDVNLDDVYEQLKITDKDEQTFARLIVEELQDEGKLTQTGKGRYAAAAVESNKNDVEGKVDFVNPRFAFIRYDDEKSDVYVEADNLNGAIDGDLVRVRITKSSSGRKNNNPEGKVVEIIERNKTEFVGKIRMVGNYALLKPEGKSMHDSLFIAKHHIHDAVSDDLVIVKILTYPTPAQQGTAEVIEVLGKSGDNNAEMHAIMAEFGLPVRFPKEVEDESEAISEKISDAEIKNRRDMRDVLTYTIDPADAKDFDDALSFKKLENGNYEIGVHIADVTHYVRPGTKLEAEAVSRATSVYLVDRTIPMLPEKLSNGLCSLRPNEDKLVFSAIFEINENTEIQKEWFGRCIIHSDRRFAYEQAQDLLDAESASGEDKPYFESLKKMNELSKVLKKKRFANGAINFETAETKFHLDAQGKPLGVYQKVRKDAHKLIEEFMLLANKQVARFVCNLGKDEGERNKDKGETKKSDGSENTMVYRIHEPPNPEKLDTFSKFAARMGFKVNTYNQNVLSSSLNTMFQEVEGKPMQNVLEQLAVRTMSKAIYSTKEIGHFGLAFDHYSHFTSPIRRYPDMMAHRLLQHYLDGKKSPATADYDEKCKHSSDQEKLAAEAERASIKYKQVEYMSLQDRKVVYEGVITGVTDFGIFVEIDGTGCEGMVSLRDMNDDYYEYDPNNYRLIGQRNGLIINFGDSVKVSIKETNLQDRSIDLTMEAIGDKVIEKGSPRKGKGGGGGRPSSRKPRKNNPQPRGKSKGKRKKR
ncbi:MAG: ribonuclease R [Spirosomataceae bacterium]|jgi:ribonuclease R